MRILSMVHGPLARAEVFGDVILAAGHELEEWSLIDEPSPPRPIEEYDAVVCLGGHMNVDQEARHPWLRGEDEAIRGLLARNVPFFGICLGGQLLAKAADAVVGPSPEQERGFTRMMLSEAAADDPVFGALPRELDVFNLHGYAFAVPEGAVELARSRVCAQAFRVGEVAWGVQFHPEVRLEQVEAWFAAEETEPDRDRVIGELASRLEAWQRVGRSLCMAFLDVASRRAPQTPVPGTVPTS